MLLFRTIQWKALFMLTVFAANFMIICHCSVQAASPASPGHSSCCEKNEKAPPCNDTNGCSGMHAVRFNLLEKQASSAIGLSPVYIHMLTYEWQIVPPTKTQPPLADQWLSRHSPPDLLSLYQCFLI